MAWVSIALRKQVLNSEVNSATYELLRLSREKTKLHRHKSYELHRLQRQKNEELEEAAEETRWNELKAQRKERSYSDSDYEEFKTDYEEAHEEYLDASNRIKDIYDDLQTDLEEEIQMEEDAIEEQKTITETQRQALNDELQALQEEVKTEIQNETIKF